MATPVQNWIGPHHDTIPILLELGVSSQHSSPMMQPITQATTQPITQPMTQPMPQAMTQAITQAMSQAVAQSVAQPMTQATTQPMTQPMPQAMTQAITQAMAQAVAQSVAQPMTQAMAQPMMQPMTQPITQPMTQAFERYDMETQTIPVWDHLMRMSLQTYLAHKLEPLLDTRLRGSKCIHLKGLSLDDLLAMVVERHNTLCVHPSVFEERKPVVQIPLEQFSEADAAAKVMVDLLNAQHQHILDGNDLHSAGEGAFQNMSDEEPKKQRTPRKRPAVSTKDDLLSKGVKLIRCDPPDHVIERAQNMWGTKQDRGRHIPAKQWYQCADCGLKLEDIHKLNRHITKHSAARSFQCPQCKRMYKTQDAVRKHVKESHNPGFKFKVFCAYCGKGFKSRKHRDDHVIVHTGERAFKCTECSKTFKNKRSVDGHMRTRHKIGKLHYCALCQCHFPFLNLLHNHLQTVHKAQVPQPMQQIFIRKCLICDVEFQDENILMQHMPSHGSQECTACTRREKRRKHFIQEAVKHGMNQEEAATRDFESLEDWFREKKAVEMAEKKAKKEKEKEKANLVVVDKAIQLGMDPELAKDVKKAQEFIKQKRTPEIPLQKKIANKSSPYMKLTADNRPQLPQNEEYEIGDAGLFADVSKMSIEELRHCQMESKKQERHMKRAMEHMKKAVNQSAIEIAFDIVESIEAEEVFGQSPKDKEMAIIRAELNARSKRGKPQKSLALIFGKKTVGLQTGRKQNLNATRDKESEILTVAEKAAETLKEVIESQKLDPVLRSEAQNAYSALKGPVEKGLGKTIEEDGKKVLGLPSATKKPVIPISIQKSSDASCSTKQGEDETIKCTVYSQDPKLTLSLVKSGSATFIINKSQSQETKGIHLVSTKLLGDETKSVSPRIVISSNIPDKIKEKLTTGKLIINVVPLKGMKLVRKRTQFLSAALEVIDSVVDQEESKEEPSSNPSLDKKAHPVRVSARQKGGNIPSISSPVAKKAVSTRNNSPASKPKKTPIATSKQKKTPAAASKQKKTGPQLSTREELVQKGVKLILCDPPEHVVEKAKQMKLKNHKKSYNRATKQWYQCEHCGKKVEDISKLKLHIRVHDTLKDQLLRPTRSETETITKTKASIPKPTPNQDSDLEPGEIRVEPLSKSQDTESVSEPQISSTQSSNAAGALETRSPAKSSSEIKSPGQESMECETGPAQGVTSAKSSQEMKNPDQKSMTCETTPAQGETPAKSSEEIKSPDQDSMACETTPAQGKTPAKSSEEMKSPDQESMECETTPAQGETPTSTQSDTGEQTKTTAATAPGPKFYCKISEVQKS